MLLELRIENYAVIESVQVKFAPGLNLLTGETGAGKSILIGALGLLLGDRASPDLIRQGAEKAALSAVFELPAEVSARVAETLSQHGIERECDSLILRREVLAGGKNRVFINNQPATVAVLRQLAPHLAAIHAQNESLLAFDGGERLRLLDAFAALDASAIAVAHARCRSHQARIAELEQGEPDRLRLLDLWSFQKKEIAQARLEAGEDSRLEAEKRVLANAEKLRAAAAAAHDLLYDSGSSAAGALRAAEKQLLELCRYEPKFQEPLAALESARITVEDLGASLRDYAAGIEASPQRLAEIEDRLALLDRLKRKYGGTLAEVLAFAAQVSAKLSEVENRDQILEQLRRELAQAGAQYLELARAASRARAGAARRLERQAEAAINSLAMSARFQIEMASDEDSSRWTAAGIDQVAFLIATNPGEAPLPLERIASGGELSRVMLALKTTIAAGTNGAGKPAPGPRRTLVFDEIDAGIGGRAAEAVGERLKALGASQQVLCITHLPQIACFADQHYLIGKNQTRTGAGLRAQTTVARLSDAQRTQELARMLSGAAITETSLRHARQLLKLRP